MARPVAYVTDVEGMWPKLEGFARDNPLLRLDGSRLEVKPGALFVFGGDAIDRGDSGRRLVGALTEAKDRQPDRVVLLAGNRDLNKLRLWRELQGHPRARAPRERVEAGLGPHLRWIFEHTMGARHAFEHRRAELAREGRAHDDEAVARSYLEDLGPGGTLREYLHRCQLAHREGATLFVHGGVTEANVLRTPGGKVAGSVDEWISDLEGWYRDQLAAFVEGRLDADGVPLWEGVIAYQAPIRGTKQNRGSVVYGRTGDDHNNPMLPPAEAIATLRRHGIERVVVGHTPNGDSPSVLRQDGFALIAADASHARVPSAPRLLLDDEGLDVHGEGELDDGEKVRVEFRLGWRDDSPIGLRDQDTGHLVRGRLADGRYLLFRYREAYQYEQTAEAPESLAQRRLGPPGHDTRKG